VVRICGVPLFIVAMLSPWPEWLSFWPDAWLWKPWLATLVFIVLAATDSLDGYLARSRHEVTNFGKFVDPLADKILTTAALLVLIELGVLPSWPVFIILCREFIVSGIRMLAAAEGRVIAASWYGKAKTVTQIIAIVLFLVKDSPVTLQFFGEAYSALYWFAWAVMAAAVVLTIVSMLDYFAKARELLGFVSSKKSASKAAVKEVSGASCPTEHQLVDADSTVGTRPREDVPAPTEDELRLLAERVLSAARRSGVSLATAESLTGGLISATLTAVPGSSDVVAGGVVGYSFEAKERALGVDAARLTAVGAVDEEVAREMARGARSQTGADMAVSVTGIAGPGGAEPGKPVGTVCFGLSAPDEDHAESVLFPGDRDEVRARTVRYALRMLEHRLEA
ncbi:MAG TPA: CDP-diacylglycerol--glycerol-3-phosphate 3-phosphatidyltransferase, partial [Candidatus Aveggerthella stercoripullorum]|nr:CDP-diacylglycerol--glycerol-3-phosphate 3-phosphatidyltransferase [Candidatus Aveggerthella stercoripullorum]